MPLLAKKSEEKFRHRLRLITRSAHKRVEAQVGLVELSGSVKAYRDVLEKFLGLLRPIERTLATLPFEGLGIVYSERRKVQWLERDLLDLGHTKETLATLPEVSTVIPRDDYEGLGVLYVLEGSSLGGQLILRELGPKLNIGPDWAGRFYNGYGKKTGGMWRSFLLALESASRRPEAASAIESAALATFASFGRHLAHGRCPFASASSLNGL